MKFRNLRLKYQITALVSIATILMILVQFVYYFGFYFVNRNKAISYAENSMNVVNTNLNFTVTSMKNIGFAFGYNPLVQEFLLEEEPVQRISLDEFASNIARYMITSSENVKDIILIDQEDRVTRYAKSLDNTVYTKLVNMYSINSEEINRGVFSSLIPDSYGNLHYAYIMPVYNSLTTGNSSGVIGLVIIVSQTKNLNSIVKETSIFKNSRFFILDKFQTVVVTNEDDNNVDILDYSVVPLLDDTNKPIITDYKGEKAIIQSKNINDVDWKIISVIPIKELMSEMQLIQWMGIIIGFVMVLLLLVTDISILRNIYIPISHIISTTRIIGEGEIEKRIDVKTENEIGKIAKDINRMLDKTQSMEREMLETEMNLYKMEISKKQADLYSLQSQINPHFLYNTLECMRSIGLNYDIQEIVKISTSMSNIFRYSIKGDEFVRFRDEIGSIKDYMDIISIRFGGKITMELFIDEKIMDLKTIKMIIQPIVENSVYHGLEQKISRGSISLNGNLENDVISLEIKDDGKGMSYNQLENIRKAISDNDDGVLKSSDENRSIGLVNINNRIRLYYGNEYGISIDSFPDEGTTVHLKLPAIY